METQVIEIEKRSTCGKTSTNRLRKQGKIPAVVYGHKEDAVPLAIDPHALVLALQHSGRRRNTVFKLEGFGRDCMVLIKDLQVDPIRRNPLHVDFIEVRDGDTVTVDIPLDYHGRPPGIVAGGTLESTRRSIRVKSSPMSIPKSFDVELGSMQIGDAITIADLTLPEGVQPAMDDRIKVAMIKAPRTDKNAEKEEEEEA